MIVVLVYVVMVGAGKNRQQQQQQRVTHIVILRALISQVRIAAFKIHLPIQCVR